MNTSTIDSSYPIGKYEPQPFSEKQKRAWLSDIEFLPQQVENALLNLDEAQLFTPYRDGGWTVQQLVHHIADSHMNAFCRFRLGLTENNPTIRPYEQQLWAELKDMNTVPVNVSVTLLHALHTRWYAMISDLTIQQWERTIFHPESKKEMTLWYVLGMYSWHGRHHVAHITSLRERNNW
jgi:hypothetical protein